MEGKTIHDLPTIDIIKDNIYKRAYKYKDGEQYYMHLIDAINKTYEYNKKSISL